MSNASQRKPRAGDDPQALLRERKLQTYRFKDDGLIPNHPKWPLIIYKRAVRLPASFDPAAVFEELFDMNGWGGLVARRHLRLCPLSFAHPRGPRHRAGNGKVQFGGTKARTLALKAGDVAILPAGTGHQCLKASEDFLVVGAYPPSGTYDVCTSLEHRKKALSTIPRVARPRKDPVYGKDGPLMRVWRKPNRGHS
jgi:uncharacterized protein YjlB